MLLHQPTVSVSAYIKHVTCMYGITFVCAQQHGFKTQKHAAPSVNNWCTQKLNQQNMAPRNAYELHELYSKDRLLLHTMPVSCIADRPKRIAVSKSSGSFIQ